jgi:ubiquinone/menaquinone biosynthesis C-methylase UbiE
MRKAYNTRRDSENNTMTSSIIDQSKLNEFMGKIVSDIGASWSTILVYMGEKLGLYKAMGTAGQPFTSAQLAKKTNTSERYVREWLANQAASGYITYNPNTSEYTLPPEHALALADEKSPVYALGAFQIAMSLYKDEPKITNAFKTGIGVDWGEHDSGLFEGTERFFRPSYVSNLVSSWIPALENGKVEEKFKQGGAKIADVGCGHGASTILMAKAYPDCKFVGFDYHEPSIEWARKKANEEGVADRVAFEVAKSTDFPGNNYDLVAFFDCLHDMGDPIGAAAHVLKSLKPDGTLMIVEPFANDKLEDNLKHPASRVFYAASTMVCVPASLAYHGPAMGAQAGEDAISKVVKAGGFKHFKRATQTPFNMVYEAKIK